MPTRKWRILQPELPPVALEKAHAKVESPVSLIDIYPTLVDLAGRAAPPGLDGHSLLPELSGRPSSSAAGGAHDLPDVLIGPQ